MKFTNALAAAAAVAAAGSVGHPRCADRRRRSDHDHAGSRPRWTDGNVVQGWTISGLKASTDTIPYPVAGTLWEATATDQAIAGRDADRLEPQRARPRRRDLPGAVRRRDPAGRQPRDAGAGREDHRKGVLRRHRRGARQRRLQRRWTGPSAWWSLPHPARAGGWTLRAAEPPRAARRTERPSDTGARQVPRRQPFQREAAAKPATEGAPGPLPPDGSQGTPFPAGSTGTPLPAGSTGTPLPAATEGAPLPVTAGTPAQPARPPSRGRLRAPHRPSPCRPHPRSRRPRSAVRALQSPRRRPSSWCRRPLRLRSGSTTTRTADRDSGGVVRPSTELSSRSASSVHATVGRRQGNRRPACH